MNKSNLKSYAPDARREFIQAVTDRAHFYGLAKDKQEPVKVDGDFAIINGKAFPKAVADQRGKLEDRIATSSFDHVMEEIAYTWFNRFVAIRYMELHEYLSHGYRVLSHPDPGNNIPEILEKAQHLELQGLDKDKVVELKMDGNKDEELYRLLLMAQCNELHRAMPFLFESIKDCTELLLPDNLLHSDSLIRKLVDEIEEEDWQEVEIIGWMYQFYISEKKDEVIGSIVKSEDIPAATQLFTPNWIVKYLVQNSLGAQWMRTYPDSALKSKMEYYIEPAEQSEDVQKQLTEITPDSLNPEELTLVDPACGSGHILVEGYDLLKEIYLERGYRKRDVAEHILKKNLFGLEIDDRAAQLSGFALMMKARTDDRRIFERQAQPNIVSIQETKELDVTEIVRAINAPLTEKDVDNSTSGDEFGFMDEVRTPLFASKSKQSFSDEEKLTVDDLKALLGLFEHGKTFGSLIRIPESLAEKLPAIANRVNMAYKSGDPYAQAQAIKVKPFIQQSLIMANRFDAVVANPPYMGKKGMNVILKDFAKYQYPDSKADIFSMFVERSTEFSNKNGMLGFVMPYVWMFISSYQNFRVFIETNFHLRSLIQLEYNAFEPACVPVCTFILDYQAMEDYKGTFIKLTDFKGHQNQSPRALEAIEKPDCGWLYYASTKDFKKIPGAPIAYWVNESMRRAFEVGVPLKENVNLAVGLFTCNNEKFLRMWPELSSKDLALKCSSVKEAVSSHASWFPYNKGGEFRKWYGNSTHVVFYKDNGKAIRSYRLNAGQSESLPGEQYYFRPSITWSFVSSSFFGVRQSDSGYIFDVGGSSAFPDDKEIPFYVAFLCSKVSFQLMQAMNPTLNFQVGNVALLPIVNEKLSTLRQDIELISRDAVFITRTDWDSFETSWDFNRLPLLEHKSNLTASFDAYRENCKNMTTKMKELEEENNRLFIGAYDLQEELNPSVPDEQITLFSNPRYRYRGNLSKEELEIRFKEDTIKELLSYSVGCMMGRYSLDESGLVYANSGNEDFDASKYKTFPADDDGIIPITAFACFDDDAAERFFSFVETVWDKHSLDDNLDYAAEAIGRKTSESSREAIRRFFCNDFFKDHLRRYKKRPIYWLFTSGKQKAFQCLVYLHRYNEGTLSRMRTEYVIPLQGRMNNRISMLEKDVESATSTSAANKIRKEITKLGKQSEELRKFDEKLRHYADMKIKLDLDDGVKVNYGKFGDLLADIKTVTGKK